MKWFIIISVFAAIGWNNYSTAQSQKNPKRFFIEDPHKKSVQLPFKLINNLVILPVFVNNSDTLNFILDSGIGNSIITDSALANKLNMHYVKEVKLCGFGGGTPLTAIHSVENEIRINGITGQHQDILVIPDPEFDFSRHLGIKIRGLLGYSLFRDLIIEINYDNNIISFHSPRTYVYKNKRNSTTLPLQIIDTKPFITTQIVQEDSSVIEGNFLIDTGASFALWLDLFSNPNLIVPQKNESLYLGTGFGGAVYGRVGRIKEFGSGFLKLKNVIASYADTSLLINPQAKDKRNGSIGADILSRFNVVFDYRNSKITLRPNSKAKAPFQVNLSGMEICCPSPGENLYSISSICKDSPAQKAGLKVGDQIIYINNQELSRLSLSEVHGMLLKKWGRKMTVQYAREGKVNSTVLVMENFI